MELLLVGGVGWTLFGSLNFHYSVNSGKEWCLHKFLSMRLLLGCQASQIGCHVSHTVLRHSRLGVATFATWCCNIRDLVLQQLRLDVVTIATRCCNHYDTLLLGLHLSVATVALTFRPLHPKTDYYCTQPHICSFCPFLAASHCEPNPLLLPLLPHTLSQPAPARQPLSLCTCTSLPATHHNPPPCPSPTSRSSLPLPLDLPTIPPQSSQPLHPAAIPRLSLWLDFPELLHWQLPLQPLPA